jgi:hypothetical protein
MSSRSLCPGGVAGSSAEVFFEDLTTISGDEDAEVSIPLSGPATTFVSLRDSPPAARSGGSHR